MNNNFVLNFYRQFRLSFKSIYSSLSTILLLAISIVLISGIQVMEKHFLPSEPYINYSIFLDLFFAFSLFIWTVHIIKKDFSSGIYQNLRINNTNKKQYLSSIFSYYYLFLLVSNLISLGLTVYVIESIENNGRFIEYLIFHYFLIPTGFYLFLIMLYISFNRMINSKLIFELTSLLIWSIAITWIVLKSCYIWLNGINMEPINWVLLFIPFINMSMLFSNTLDSFPEYIIHIINGVYFVLLLSFDIYDTKIHRI